MTFLAVMDPPWSADTGGGRRGANTHYALAGVDGIAQAVRMSGLWVDSGPALVWMWATSSALVNGDAHGLANRLGLRICAGFVWVKVDEFCGACGLRAFDELPCCDAPAYSPTTRMGLGQWSRCEHEHLLVCRRGEVRVPKPSARQPSVIYAPRGRHSAKPQAAWDVIVETSRSSVGLAWGVEFFARTARPGWTAWGNEAPR